MSAARSAPTGRRRPATRSASACAIRRRRRRKRCCATIGGKARAGTAAEAAAFADIIVLSTPWPATEAAIRSMGNIKGKIILDATNPLTRGPDGISAGDRPQHLRRRKGAGLGGGRLGVQDAQHHRLRQYGEPGVQRREVGDVRRRRRRRQQAEGDQSGRRARLRGDRRRAFAQRALAGGARHAVDRSRARARPGPRLRLCHR